MTPFEFHTNMHFTQIVGEPHPPEKHQWQGACPFCKKDKHFFFSATYKWDCKHCQRNGNVYTFIKFIHQIICKTERIELLSSDRSISIDTLRNNNVRWNPLNSSYVIPCYNSDGNVNQLYKATPNVNKEGSYRIGNTPSIEGQLYNWPSTTYEDIWLVEGIMDKLAAEDIVGQSKISVIGFPGSSFKHTWCSAVSGKNVKIITDNDDAGGKIRKIILDRFNESPKKPASVQVVSWSNELKKGYDTNDVLKDHKSEALAYIKNILTDISTASPSQKKKEIAVDTSCDTYEKLITSCSDVFHFTKDMDDLVHLLITALYALKIEGEQLWLRVIGPPGSSKTTLATMVGSSAQAVVESTFTGLFSGWKDDDPTDASMISRIEGKALIIKDADALLQQPNKEQIFSELRDYYDKSISVSYRNRVSYSYEDSRAAFILCGTHALRGIDNSALGERFFDFELTVTEEDREKMTDKMLDRSIEEGETGKSIVNNLKSKAKNLIDNVVLNESGVAKITPDAKEATKILSQLLAFMRAKVERHKNGELKYRPSPEVPTRLTGQFTKFFQCAPIVVGNTITDDKTIDLARRVAMDGMDKHSLRFGISHMLCKMPGQTLSSIVDFIDKDSSIVERELDNMKELNMLKINKVQTGVNVAVATASLRPGLEEKMKYLTREM